MGIILLNFPQNDTVNDKDHSPQGSCLPVDYLPTLELLVLKLNGPHAEVPITSATCMRIYYCKVTEQGSLKAEVQVTEQACGHLGLEPRTLVQLAFPRVVRPAWALARRSISAVHGPLLSTSFSFSLWHLKLQVAKPGVFSEAIILQLKINPRRSRMSTLTPA